MKQISMLVVLLSCFTIFAAGKPAPCNLLGLWKNDLGSNMTIVDMKSDGQFSGIYLTAVTSTNETILKSPLIGYQQQIASPTFGFTVNWTFSSSITVFTGQCFINATGFPVLRTMWLLRSKSANIQDDWMQTRVGYDIFYKLPTNSLN